MEKITQDNVFEVDVSGLALNERFGALVFDESNKKLKKSQDWLKEVYDLNYKDILPESDIHKIKNLTKKLAENLQWLADFDISNTERKPKQEHDDFNNRVNNFYDEVYQAIPMKILLFLRDERRRESPEEKKLDVEVTEAVRVRSELEAELAKIKQEVKKIKETDVKVATAKGERAAVRMYEHFEKEASRYNAISKLWLIVVAMGYITFVCLLLNPEITAESYFYMLISEDKNTVWKALISRLAGAGIIWLGLSFIIKNYNVSSQLAATNRHRAAVAKTLGDFVEAEQKQEQPRLTEMLQNATDAMFKHTHIGFVSKNEKEASNPVLQIINDIIGTRSSS